MMCTMIPLTSFVSLAYFTNRQLVFNAEGQVIGKIELSQSLERRMVHDAYYQRGVNWQSMYRMLPIQATNGHLLYCIDVRGSGAIK